MKQKSSRIYITKKLNDMLLVHMYLHDLYEYVFVRKKDSVFDCFYGQTNRFPCE